MDRPFELVFRNMQSSGALETSVREHVSKLEDIYQHIVGCRVTIELQNHTHHTGDVPDVHIDIQVPGQDLVVNHQHSRGSDALTSIHHAFEAAASQLKEYKARKRGHIKHHDVSHNDGMLDDARPIPRG